MNETQLKNVNYVTLDAFKRRAMVAARSMADQLQRFGFTRLPESVGESASLIDCGPFILAFVVEGLGTKMEVALEILKKTGRSYFYSIAWDNNATVLNDLAVCGASPIMYNGFIATGSSQWFNPAVSDDFLHGCKEALEEAGSAWGGGETQELQGVVFPHTAVLAGAAVGVIKPKKRRIKGNIRHGDVIIIVLSSGINANGLTAARDIAAKLSEGYETRLPNGMTYGEALLSPTHLYPRLIDKMLDTGIPVHYVSSITGHGWRKVMRHPDEFRYVIKELPPRQPLFDFIQDQTGSSPRKMYETLNMGGDLAIITSPRGGPRVIEAARFCGFHAYNAGLVEEGRRSVLLEEIGEEFVAEDYQVR